MARENIMQVKQSRTSKKSPVRPNMKRRTKTKAIERKSARRISDSSAFIIDSSDEDTPIGKRLVIAPPTKRDKGTSKRLKKIKNASENDSFLILSTSKKACDESSGEEVSDNKKCSKKGDISKDIDDEECILKQALEIIRRKEAQFQKGTEGDKRIDKTNIMREQVEQFIQDLSKPVGKNIEHKFEKTEQAPKFNSKNRIKERVESTSSEIFQDIQLSDDEEYFREAEVEEEEDNVEDSGEEEEPLQNSTLSFLLDRISLDNKVSKPADKQNKSKSQITYKQEKSQIKVPQQSAIKKVPQATNTNQIKIIEKELEQEKLRTLTKISSKSTKLQNKANSDSDNGSTISIKKAKDAYSEDDTDVIQIEETIKLTKTPMMPQIDDDSMAVLKKLIGVLSSDEKRTKTQSIEEEKEHAKQTQQLNLQKKRVEELESQNKLLLEEIEKTRYFNVADN